jgi:esterase/lipase superfamily enzyme
MVRLLTAAFLISFSSLAMAAGLRIATTLQAGDPVYGSIVELGRASAELTKADASIQVVEKGSERERAQEALRLLDSEKADIAVLEMSAIADKPILGYSRQPFLVKDVDAARRLDLRLRRDVTRILQMDLKLRLLGTLPQLPRVVLSKRPSWDGSLYGANVLVTSPLEAEGFARIRVGYPRLVAPPEAVIRELAGGAADFAFVPLSSALSAGKASGLYLYDVRSAYPVMAVVTNEAALARFTGEQRNALTELVQGLEALAWERIDRVAERAIGRARAKEQILFGSLTDGVGDNFSKMAFASLDANARQSVSEVVQRHAVIEQQPLKFAGEQQAYGKCRNLEVLLITNRALPAKFQPGADGVLPQRGEELLASLAPAPQFGVVEVQVQARSHDPAATRVECRDADGRPAAATAVIVRQARILDRKAFLAIAGRAGGGFDNRAPFLVFVHGYRVSFRDGVETAAKLSGRMRNEMRPVLVSWPSAGNLRNYGQDGAMASGSPEAVRNALETLGSLPGPRPITLVAHSMGNRIALDALESLRAAGRTGILDELASVAPDVQCARYASIMQKLQGVVKPADRMFRRGTLYLYEGDYALKASKAYWTLNDRKEVCRMGSQRGPTAAAGATALEPVDWSCINEVVDSHSYYVLNDYIARDLRDAVLSHKVPKDRDLEFGTTRLRSTQPIATAAATDSH